VINLADRRPRSRADRGRRRGGVSASATSVRRTSVRRTCALLRVDADATVGFGHVVRCSALFAALGANLDMVVAGDDAAALRASFPAARVHSVNREGFGQILRSERPELVVVDLPRHSTGVWREARRFARLVVAVDDQGGAIEADIVISGAPPSACRPFPALDGGARALTGPAYALLRPEFAVVRWRSPGPPSVAIVVGSGARARDWAFALAGDALDRSAWGDVAMAVGRGFSQYDRLGEACARARIRLLNGLEAGAMAQHLAGAQAALITGGMVMPETLAVGTPAVVFPQIESMQPETRWFAERRAICDLGFDGGMEMGRVRDEVDRLLSDRDAARKQSACGRELVDGRGAERAASLISSRLAERLSKQSS